jgi:hypothetical protein
MYEAAWHLAARSLFSKNILDSSGVLLLVDLWREIKRDSFLYPNSILWHAALCLKGDVQGDAVRGRPTPQKIILTASCNCLSSFVFPVIVPNAPLVGVVFGPPQFG